MLSKLLLSVIIPLSYIVVSCSPNEYTSQVEPIQFSVHYSYRLPSEEMLSLARNLPELSHFTPFYEMEDSNFLDIVLGTTADSIYKTPILETLNRNDSLCAECRLGWSKYITNNQISGDRYYKLFIFEKTPQLTNQHIRELKVGESMFDKSFDLRIELTDEGADILHRMTSTAFENNNSAIAIVLDDEVVSSPYVQAPLDNGVLTIGRYESKSDVEQIIKRFGK